MNDATEFQSCEEISDDESEKDEEKPKDREGKMGTPIRKNKEDTISAKTRELLQRSYSEVRSLIKRKDTPKEAKEPARTVTYAESSEENEETIRTSRKKSKTKTAYERSRKHIESRIDDMESEAGISEGPSNRQNNDKTNNDKETVPSKEITQDNTEHEKEKLKKGVNVPTYDEEEVKKMDILDIMETMYRHLKKHGKGHAEQAEKFKNALRSEMRRTQEMLNSALQNEDQWDKAVDDRDYKILKLKEERQRDKKRIEELETVNEQVLQLQEELKKKETIIQKIEEERGKYQKTIHQYRTELEEGDNAVTQHIRETMGKFEQNILQKLEEIKTENTINKRYEKIIQKQKGQIDYYIKKKDPTLSTVEFQQKIDAIDFHEVTINDCHKLRSGGIHIQCTNKDDIEKVKEQLKQTDIGEKIEIKRITRRIIIFQLPYDKTDKHIKESIEKELGQTIEFDQIKVNKQKDHYNMVIDIDKTLADNLMKRKRILIGIKRCPIDQYVSLKRCYRCQDYGHSAAQCDVNKNEQYCVYCAQHHTSFSCNQKNNPEKYCCINCSNQNYHYKTELNTNHSASSTECLTYRRKLQQKRQTSQKQSFKRTQKKQNVSGECPQT